VASATHSEGELQAEVLAAVGALPHALFWRNNVGAMHDGQRMVFFGQKGAADVLGCYRGHAVAIEVKALRGALKARQRKWRAAWERAGGVYLVAKVVRGELPATTAARVCTAMRAAVEAPIPL